MNMKRVSENAFQSTYITEMSSKPKTSHAFTLLTCCLNEPTPFVGSR